MAFASSLFIFCLSFLLLGGLHCFVHLPESEPQHHDNRDADKSNSHAHYSQEKAGELLVTIEAEGTFKAGAHGRGHVAGTCCSDSLPRVTYPFLRNILLWGQNFVPATCCMKFSWFEFERQVAGTK